MVYVAVEDVSDETSRNIFENVVGVVGAAARLAPENRDEVVGVDAREVGGEVDVIIFGHQGCPLQKRA